MPLRFILLFLCSALLTPAYAGLDLTPLTREYTEDGATYRVVSLRNDDGIVKFFPPDGWTVRGQHNRLQLSPPKMDLSEGVVEVTPLAAPQPLDETVVAAFKQNVLANLPPGSRNIKVLLEAENTLMPGDKPSFEVMVSYQLWGKNYQRSVLLVNGTQERLVFRLSAKAEDFNLLQNAFRRSIASWQWINKPATVLAQVPASAPK
jgi:hypothetical protein